MGKINDKKFELACKDSFGILTVIANKLNVTRKAVYDYLKRMPDANDFIFQERQRLIDTAEEKLAIKIGNNEDWAIRYILSTLGQGRGWIEKPAIQVIEKQNNVQINIQTIRDLIKKNEEIWN